MKRFLIVLALHVLAAYLLAWAGHKALAWSTDRVPAGQIGVRIDTWGGGVDPRDYPSGLHFGQQGRHEWHFVPEGGHLLAFSDRTDGPAPLEIRTSDNNSATVSAVFGYELVEGEAHALVADGLERVWHSRVRSVVEGALRRRLSELATEDWFSSATRRGHADAILAELDGELRPLHVRARHLLLFGAGFGSDYEKKLQERQIFEQKLLLDEINIELAEAEAQRSELLTEANAQRVAIGLGRDAELSALRIEADREIEAIRTSAIQYVAQTRGAADAEYARAVATAEHELEAIRADAKNRRLAALDSAGGHIYLAREAARGLEIEEITLNSNDPDVPSVIDLGEMTRLLLGDLD